MQLFHPTHIMSYIIGNMSNLFAEFSLLLNTMNSWQFFLVVSLVHLLLLHRLLSTSVDRTQMHPVFPSLQSKKIITKRIRNMWRCDTLSIRWLTFNASRVACSYFYSDPPSPSTSSSSFWYSRRRTFYRRGILSSSFLIPLSFKLRWPCCMCIPLKVAAAIELIVDEERINYAEINEKEELYGLADKVN